MDINSINNSQGKTNQAGAKKSEQADNAGKAAKKGIISKEGISADDKVTLSAMSIEKAQNIGNLILSDHKAAALAIKNIDALKAQELIG
ncbi:MAG TPA: hypothetical protein DHV16_07210 [Nitrospiraceae bacterium]|nr:MAG: hypothetical protein A2Z82_01775 [Nitrospirae bacterium GWA2_46_11]OGW22692.1 MAG: hypothetical protein A2X55_11110 [Nitrospirae bacterium GWB2_47_37]HAK87914.1 hypothetical protein [Nitrospiraceae bacterium]HCL81309.1 hypothetical protein [Nitrospiraceae bacterium]HCZ12029.1 hypothetical protein [Nitrospiraceae bacterium]